VLDYELILEEVIGLSSLPPPVVVIELTGTIAQFIKLLVVNKMLEYVLVSNLIAHSALSWPLTPLSYVPARLSVVEKKFVAVPGRCLTLSH